MTAELFCPTHGPYDAAYETCPYCSGDFKRPGPPTPLEEDDLPTDIGQPQPYQAPGIDDEAPTDLGPGRRVRGRILDIDDEEPTDIGGYVYEDVTELDEIPTGLLGILWVKEGHRRGKIYQIANETVIGRREGDLILDDPKVSNPHAKFTVEDELFILWDFGSKNGTYVNGERIRAATTLQENDTVKMGDTTFVLKILT
jgi:hypothetical protein